MICSCHPDGIVERRRQTFCAYEPCSKLFSARVNGRAQVYCCSRCQVRASHKRWSERKREKSARAKVVADRSVAAD